MPNWERSGKWGDRPSKLLQFVFAIYQVITADTDDLVWVAIALNPVLESQL
jgi:hypothetical protein